MKKIYLLICLCGILVSFNAGAQYSRFIIRFTDKKGTGYSIGSPSAYLSAKAIARRTRYHIAIDSTDLPVTKAYLDSIKAVPNLSLIHILCQFKVL